MSRTDNLPPLAPPVGAHVAWSTTPGVCRAPWLIEHVKVRRGAHDPFVPAGEGYIGKHRRAPGARVGRVTEHTPERDGTGCAVSLVAAIAMVSAVLLGLLSNATHNSAPLPAEPVVEVSTDNPSPTVIPKGGGR